MTRRAIPKPIELTSEVGSRAVVSTEYWLVIFLEFSSGPQFKIFQRVGSLINAVEEKFGYADMPEHAVYWIRLDKLTVTPVEGPTYRK